MNFKNSALQAIITALVKFKGWGDIFTRVKDGVQRVNDSMPYSTGAEKKAQFEAWAKVIFDQAIVPVGGLVLDTLIQLALIYLQAQSQNK